MAFGLWGALDLDFIAKLLAQAPDVLAALADERADSDVMNGDFDPRQRLSGERRGRVTKPRLMFMMMTTMSAKACQP